MRWTLNLSERQVEILRGLVEKAGKDVFSLSPSFTRELDGLLSKLTVQQEDDDDVIECTKCHTLTPPDYYFEYSQQCYDCYYQECLDDDKEIFQHD